MLSKNEIKRVRELHTQKGRESAGAFIAEGPKITDEIIAERPEIITTIYATANAFGNYYDRHPSVDVIEVSDDELRKLSVLTTANRVVTVCKQPSHKNDNAAQPLSFYLDDIRDPGNFGTIIRICSWFGMENLYCSESCCELYNPKVIQSTMGAFLRVNVIYTDLKNAKSLSGTNNIYGAQFSGEDLYATKLKRGIVIIGNEAHGINPQNAALVDTPLRIPRPSGNATESLNAAVAASIIASEFYRQMNYNG
jgi:RNA methyltransferase, TrmH family